MKFFLMMALALLFQSCAVSADKEPQRLAGEIPQQEPEAPMPPEVETSSETVAAEPYVWPVATKIGGRRIKIVSPFGKRKAPAAAVEGSSTAVVAPMEPHEGVDFAVPPGSAVRAARSGNVLFAGFSTSYTSRKNKKEKHHLVIVRHADGSSSRYVHLDKLRVRPGALVKAGDTVGISSDSDEWKEPVVHFEIRDAGGKALNPQEHFEEVLTNPEKTIP